MNIKSLVKILRDLALNKGMKQEREIDSNIGDESVELP